MAGDKRPARGIVVPLADLITTLTERIMTMETSSIREAEPANSFRANQKRAYDGLNALASWKNALNHHPFNSSSCSDGQIPLSYAHGMIDIMQSLFAAGGDNAEQPNDITNISDLSVAAALSGISTLLDLSRSEANAFEYRKSVV